MKTLSVLVLILKHLPEIIRLIELLEKNVQEAKTDRKVKDDLETINEAFKNQDAEALRNLFNS